MEIITGIIALMLGILCGIVWSERRERVRALEVLAQTDKIHKEAVEALGKVQEKVIAEHTALMDKMNALEHVIANRNQGPLVRSFNPKI